MSQASLTENATIHLRGKYGFIIPHRSFMSHLLQGPSLALELDYEKQTLGKKSWHEAFNFPYVGLTTFYYDYGNPKVLGQSFGLMPYMSFHLIEKESFELNLRIGVGASYTTEKFDTKTNYKNLALGSHVNATADVMLEVRKAWKRFILSAGIEFMHHSNGSTFLPNSGINTPTFNLGMGYRLSAKEFEKKEPLNPISFNKKWMFQFLSIASAKQEYPVGTPHYGIASLGLSGIKMFNLKSGLMARFDWMYNNAHKRYITNFEKSNFSQIWQAGISAHYYVSLEKLKFLIGLGAYIKNSLNPDGPIYSRLGMQYQLPSGWMANLSLKSHLAVADYVEIGIGYTLKR